MTNIEIFNKVTDLATLDEKQIARITERLPEYKRGSSMIGHGTSQSSYSLQTMQMISDSPLSRMKQCLAQIDKKYKALQEAYYKIEKKKLTMEKLRTQTDDHSILTLQEYESQVESITMSMNASLREIGMFQDMYDGIKKNNNIPDNWDEKDYEKQEISNMVRSSFRLAVQYWEQLGIHPQLAESRARSYLVLIQEKINSSETVTIRDMYLFLDKMAYEFKDSYQDALSRMGLDELGSDEFMAKGATKPQ